MAFPIGHGRSDRVSKLAGMRRMGTQGGCAKAPARERHSSGPGARSAEFIISARYLLRLGLNYVSLSGGLSVYFNNAGACGIFDCTGGGFSVRSAKLN